MPAASPSVTISETTSRSVSLLWEELSPEDHNGIITGYTVTISDLDDLSGSTEVSFFTEFLNITIPDLSPYTTYGLLVTAHTDLGPGPSSDLHIIQTMEEGSDWTLSVCTSIVGPHLNCSFSVNQSKCPPDYWGGL